jgi:hypothetical protein
MYKFVISTLTVCDGTLLDIPAGIQLQILYLKNARLCASKVKLRKLDSYGVYLWLSGLLPPYLPYRKR